MSKPFTESLIKMYIYIIRLFYIYIYMYIYICIYIYMFTELYFAPKYVIYLGTSKIGDKCGL